LRKTARSLTGGGDGSFEAPDWNTADLAFLHKAFSDLAVLGSAASDAFDRQELVRLVENLVAEITRTVDCPAAVVATSESQTERVLMAISKRDLLPSRVDDLKTAVSIAAAFVPGKPLIVGPVNPEQLVEAEIELPKRAEYIAGVADPVKWAEQISNRGDLVVLVSQVRYFGRHSLEIQEMGRSVVVVAASKATRWETGLVAPRLSMIKS
jgi:hypothetical protein